LTLLSTFSTHKRFSVRGTAGGQGAGSPTLYFGTPSLSRKLIDNNNT